MNGIVYECEVVGGFANDAAKMTYPSGDVY